MFKKEKICFLLILIMVLHGICFASIRTYFVADRSGSEEIVISEPTSNIMLKEDVIYANEISSLSHTIYTIDKETKMFFGGKENVCEEIFDLHNVHSHLKYYLTSSIEIMSDNSSIAQNVIISYLYSKDGDKWNTTC